MSGPVGNVPQPPQQPLALPAQPSTPAASPPESSTKGPAEPTGLASKPDQATVSAQGAKSQPSPSLADLVSKVKVAATAAPTGKDARFLNIAGTSITHASVGAVAGYSGTLSPEAKDEFERRYGYMDYAVIQTTDKSGEVAGRVYAYTGDSSGRNAALAGAKPGTPVTIKDASGHVTYQGNLLYSHDFESATLIKSVPSPDGQWVANISAAGYHGANYLTVENKSTGAITGWQAGSTDKDLYLDVMWFGNKTLTVEGTPDNQQIFQNHNDGHYVSGVLAGAEVATDAAAAGLKLSDYQSPAIIGVSREGDVLTYKTRLFMAEGPDVEKTWQGTLKQGADGTITCTDRRMLP